MIPCNYYNKIGCKALAHKEPTKSVMAYWIDHGNGLMQVYCCEECAKIVEATEDKAGSSVITSNA